MKKFRLNREEQAIENELIKGSYFDVKNFDFEDIAESLVSRKRNTILNIRVNKEDIENIKKFAKKFGIGYQSLISELIHKASKRL